MTPRQSADPTSARLTRLIATIDLTPFGMTGPVPHAQWPDPADATWDALFVHRFADPTLPHANGYATWTNKDGIRTAITQPGTNRQPPRLFALLDFQPYGATMLNATLQLDTHNHQPTLTGTITADNGHGESHPTTTAATPITPDATPDAFNHMILTIGQATLTRLHALADPHAGWSTERAAAMR